MNDKTESYSVVDIDAIEIKKVLDYVYEALEERGYHPTNQLVGYLISGDPGYISSYKDARKKIQQFDRSKILGVLLECFQGR